MKIGIINSHFNQVGGIETYLARFIPLLQERGHDLFMVNEKIQDDRAPISEDSAVPKALFSEDGLARLRAWKPDVLYCHGLSDVTHEDQVLEVAPAVYFAHAYRGLCLNGGKTHKRPEVIPCQITFGPGCLFHYYLRRCGGLNPMTAWKQYGDNRKRLAFFERYRYLVTHSKAMREEFLKLGIPAEKVKRVGFFVNRPTQAFQPQRLDSLDQRIHILFVGRMEMIKGGLVFLRAIQQFLEQDARNVSLYFAGNGPDKSLWEAEAQKCVAAFPGERLRVQFLGWINDAQREEWLQKIHVLAVPSLWPEPFGQVGVEAGFFRVPSIGFDVGGISDWLEDGVNGHIAPGRPPTHEGFSEALARCVSSEEHWRKLGEGAFRTAEQYMGNHHLETMLHLFEEIQDRPST